MPKEVKDEIDVKKVYPLVHQFLKLAKMEYTVGADFRDNYHKEALVLKKVCFDGDPTALFWKNLNRSLKTFLQKNTPSS